MAKIAILLPREEMVEPAKELAEEFGLDVVAIKAVYGTNLIHETDSAIAAGAEIIVARGRQASIIKHYTTTPVLEIRLTGQEIALLLSQCIKLCGKPSARIAIICFKNMLDGIEYFENVFGITLLTYFVEDTEDMETAVLRAIEDKADIIVGGDFVNDYCRRLEFPTLFLNSTRDSLRTALKNAKSVSYATDQKKKNTAHLETLLNYSFNGIIELDVEGNIVQMNNVARRILKKEDNELIGSPITKLMNKGDAQLLEEAIGEGTELYSSVITLSGILVVANIASVVVNDVIEGSIFSFYEMKRLVKMDENAQREKYLRRHVAAGNFDLIIQKSKEMKAAVKKASLFAPINEPLLLMGELGTGKQWIAQSIHNTSPISKGPFVTLLCNENESERSFTLLARQADNGTLYLDNVDRLGSAVQTALFRLITDKVLLLDEEKYPLPVTVRVVASTRQNLFKLVQSGHFSEELYYLLTHMVLQVPPLRSRTEDLNQIIQNTINECCKRHSRYIVLTADARKKLAEYHWPGNLTQLRSFIENMVIGTPSRTVNDVYIDSLLEQLYPEQNNVWPQDGKQVVLVKSKEAMILTELLDKHNGSRTAVAEELGISKTTLWRRMKKYGIYNKYGM